MANPVYGDSLSVFQPDKGQAWWDIGTVLPLLYQQGLGAMPSNAYDDLDLSTWGASKGTIPVAQTQKQLIAQKGAPRTPVRRAPIAPAPTAPTSLTHNDPRIAGILRDSMTAEHN